METKRQERMNALIARLASEFINRESNRTAIITVTRAEMAEDGKEVRIFISALPYEKVPAVLDFLGRQRREFQNYVKSHARIGIVPRITFLQEPNLT